MVLSLSGLTHPTAPGRHPPPNPTRFKLTTVSPGPRIATTGSVDQRSVRSILGQVVNPSPIQPPELSRDHVALAAVSAIVEVTSLVVADGADAEAMRLAQDLGMDSAQRIEVALEVEDDLDVALDDLRVGEIRTLGELIDHVCAAVLNPVANAA